MKFPKMNPKIKKMWVKALRSGEYGQGQKRLLTIEKSGEHSFCCLGVLCDLHSRETGEKWNIRNDLFDGKVGAYEDYETMPGEGVDSWAGLDTEAQDILASMNDDRRLSFKQIANWIQNNL